MSERETATRAKQARPHARTRRPYALPTDRCTLVEAYREILEMPKSTFMALYRKRGSSDYEHWVRELDIRELKNADGRTLAVHCSRTQVEALRDRRVAAELGDLALDSSERARRLGRRRQ